MKASTSSVGAVGEDVAAAELKKQGYRIIELNFRAAGGEIDIIAEHRGVLVFIEVKSRADESFGTPFDAVHPGKQRKIISAAKAFVAMKGFGSKGARFDVVGVELGHSPPKVTILKDAFVLGM